MASKVYDVGTIQLIDGTEIELKPLKIKYLRHFMDYFDRLLNTPKVMKSL
jgi:hypothetical protein